MAKKSVSKKTNKPAAKKTAIKKVLRPVTKATRQKVSKGQVASKVFSIPNAVPAGLSGSMSKQQSAVDSAAQTTSIEPQATAESSPQDVKLLSPPEPHNGFSVWAWVIALILLLLVVIALVFF